MTITIGWWAIPAAMTIALIVWGFLPSKSTAQGYSAAGQATVDAIYMLAGLVACLTAWLIWAMLR